MARKDPKVTKKIRNRIEKWDKWWRINRELYYEWIQFVLGDQWKEDESKLFERYNKIPLTFNKLGALTNHMLGNQQQNTPSIQISPDQSVPEQTAEVRAALVKNISLDSDTKSIYQWAFQCALIGGHGAYGIRTKYKDKHSFDLEIEVYRINDPTRAYWDVSAETPCKTDGMYAGIKTRMSRKKFRSIYGKKVEANIGSDSLNNDVSLNWADDDSITIIDDYERKYDTVNIYKLSNNETIDQDEFNALEKMDIDGMEMVLYDGEPVTVFDKRETERYKIKHRKIAGDYILDESDFPSEQLPIVFVDQNSWWDKNGQQICKPFFQDVKDAQRYLNYLATQSAYILKVSRYDQFMVPRSAVKNPDTQQIWRDPSIMQGGLVYDDNAGNTNVPIPLRPPELSASLTQQYERTMMDLQSGTGLYNTQVGEKGNEISGKAVDARTQQGSYNTYVPFNSLNRAIACGAQIIDEMIPNVYDTERMLRLKMEDGNMQDIEINKPMDDYGIQTQNDMKEGRYKIRLNPGPSYEGQKAEGLESMEMVLRHDPSLFKLIGDLYVENLPVPNNIELRNRVRTIIPPEIIQAGKTGKQLPPKPEQPSPEQMMAQLKQQELQMKGQQAQMDHQSKMQDLELKKQEMQRKAIETQQSMHMELQEIEAKKEEAAAKLQETLLRYDAEMKNMQNAAAIAHADNLVKLLTHHPKEHKESKSH